jgi:tRNA-dihydrouridine synthase B
MPNFWLKLRNQGLIYALAPLAGITDSPFRQICQEFGADVVYSEMASVAALVYSPAKTLAMLASAASEQPFVIQLFGALPEQFAQAVRLLEAKKIKADGIDINFGCPVAKVLKQGAGAALFQDLKKSRQVIQAVADNTDLPLSVKTRSGAGQVSVLDFLAKMSDLPLAAIMIHGRTLKQGFKGEVDAAIIAQAKKYFTGVILANGGVKDVISAKALLQASNADGLGIASGALGRPWIFQELKEGREILMNRDEIFKLMLKHAKLVEKQGGNFQEFRKHLCWYAAGLPDAKELRGKFIKVNSLEEIKNILKQ